MLARFTYCVITPESAEQGEFAENGYIMPGMWKFPLRDEECEHEETLNAARNGEFDLTDLDEVINFAESLGMCEDGGSWLSSVDPDQDYQTGEDTFYSLHLEGVTPSTYNRIKNYMGIK